MTKREEWVVAGRELDSLADIEEWLEVGRERGWIPRTNKYGRALLRLTPEERALDWLERHVWEPDLSLALEVLKGRAGKDAEWTVANMKDVFRSISYLGQVGLIGQPGVSPEIQGSEPRPVDSEDSRPVDPEQSRRFAWILRRLERLPELRGGRRGFEDIESPVNPRYENDLGTLWRASGTAQADWDEDHADAHARAWIRKERLPKGYREASLDVGWDKEDEDEPTPAEQLEAVEPTQETHLNPWHGQPAQWEVDQEETERIWSPAAPDLPDLPVESEYWDGRWREFFRIPLGLMLRYIERRPDNLTPAEEERLKLYETGMPLKAIAKRQGVSPAAVRKSLLKATKKRSLT